MCVGGGGGGRGEQGFKLFSAKRLGPQLLQDLILIIEA